MAPDIKEEKPERSKAPLMGAFPSPIRFGEKCLSGLALANPPQKVLSYEQGHNQLF